MEIDADIRCSIMCTRVFRLYSYQSQIEMMYIVSAVLVR